MIRIAAPLLAAGLLVGCSGPARDPSTSATPPQTGTPPASTDVLAQAFGTGVPLATGRPSNQMRGDFDGDGSEDLLAIVAVKGRATDLAKSVRIVRPWPASEGESVSDDLTRGASVNLAIVHGFLGTGPRQAFLIHDDHEVSVLDAPAAERLAVLPRSRLSALAEPELARAARGDVIVVPTEAGIDTYLYWDGTTYRLFAPAELP